MNFLDAFRKRKQPDAAIPPPTMQPEIQRLLAAKGGKATVSTTPAASNIGEQVAAQTAGNELAAQKQQAAVQDQALNQAAQGVEQTQSIEEQRLASARQTAESGMAAKSQMERENVAATVQTQTAQIGNQEALKVAQINNAATQELAKLASERNTTVDNLFAEFDRSNRELSARKDVAQIEQLGFLYSMADKEYMSEVDRIGRERGLTQELAYREEASRLVLGDSLDAMIDKLGWREVMDANERDWAEQLAAIDIDTAMQIVQADIKAKGELAMYQGGAQVVAAGADAAYKYSQKSDTSSTATTPNPSYLPTSNNMLNAPPQTFSEGPVRK